MTENSVTKKTIAIFYEHPEWFEPLFAEFDRRDINYKKLHVQEHTFDPAASDVPYTLVVNRVSALPSTVSQPDIVSYVQQYLAYLDAIGTPVINGHTSYAVGASKALQSGIFSRLGLRSPHSIVIHDVRQATRAAAELTFPVIIKPSVGGSGAGIVKFDSHAELEERAQSGTLDLGIGQTALVQEFLPARGSCIMRVEILDGEFLYALRLPIAADSFNYCPADGCNVTAAGLAVEAFVPPPQIVDDVTRILAASHADLGGVEYLVNDRDGEVYYYDINPLSNFVANAEAVVGFDPVARFVDYVVRRAGGQKE